LGLRGKEIRRPVEGNPRQSGGVRAGEQDGEESGSGKGWMGAPGWDGMPANKCKRDGEALPGFAIPCWGNRLVSRRARGRERLGS
jgi:hypothetical protein